MIIFLYGPDDYRRTQKKRAVIAEFVKKRSDIGLEMFDFESRNAPAAAEQFLRTQSLFDAPKLAILENAFELETKQLSRFLKPFLDAKESTVLISEKDKPVKALAFLLEKPAISQKFETLAGAEWLAFVKTSAKEQGVDLAPAAAQFLANVFAGNTWGLMTELEKLAGLSGVHADTAHITGKAAGKLIDKSDLAAFDLEVAPNYWALMNGLKSFDMKNRLYAFESILALSDPPAKIFNILAAQWQEKTPHMAEYDLAVKSGKVDYEEALVDLLVS